MFLALYQTRYSVSFDPPDTGVIRCTVQISFLSFLLRSQTLGASLPIYAIWSIVVQIMIASSIREVLRYWDYLDTNMIRLACVLPIISLLPVFIKLGT